MALRIPAILFLAVLARTADARRVRDNSATDLLSDLQVTCKKVLKGNYCPLGVRDAAILDAMMGKSPEDWECMAKWADEGDDQCKAVKTSLTQEMKRYTGGHSKASPEKVAKFRQILELEEVAPTPALSSTKPWENERKAQLAAGGKADTISEAAPVSSEGSCWCPRLARSENHQGGFESKFKKDLFSYNKEAKSGGGCGEDCKECYSAVQNSAVVSCCESGADGKADSTQCAEPFHMPNKEFEAAQPCTCGGLSMRKSALWAKQSKKTCWPNTACYAGPGKNQCCPAA